MRREWPDLNDPEWTNQVFNKALEMSKEGYHEDQTTNPVEWPKRLLLGLTLLKNVLQGFRRTKI